jgi:ComF family protein
MNFLQAMVNKFSLTHDPGPWTRLFDLLLPPRCHSCCGPLDGSGPIHLCGTCHDALTPILSPLCSCCGTPFATAGGNNHPCGDCQRKPPPFTAARAAYVYDGPLRDMIHRFKYRHQVRLRRPLGLLTAHQLTETVRQWQPDLLVPVPLHPRRLRERGFNQAILLGTLLVKTWQIPLARTALSRTRWTVPQIELHHAEREANVRGAFAVVMPAAVVDKRILLLDDVLTTGSTVTECARMLRKAGASEVFVLAIARALPG